jgi:hypothetical protein
MCRDTVLLPVTASRIFCAWFFLHVLSVFLLIFLSSSSSWYMMFLAIHHIKCPTSLLRKHEGSDDADPDNPIVHAREEDLDELLGRAYLFWTPHRWLALRAEYLFERLKSEGATDQPLQLNTHRVPLGIGFFHPSGLSASIRTTYFKQKGEFLRDIEVLSGSDDFWIVDVAVNYRLPKRYGFITVGATNLFDQEFLFFDTDFGNPSIQPDRMFFSRVTLALP